MWEKESDVSDMIRVFDHTSADRVFDHTSAEESVRHCLILNRLYRGTWVKDIGDLSYVFWGLSSHDAEGGAGNTSARNRASCGRFPQASAFPNDR
jgi:hypothetical protein